MGTRSIWMDDPRARGMPMRSQFRGGWSGWRRARHQLRPRRGDSGFWQDISRGTTGLPRFGSVRVDPGRTGMLRIGRSERCQRQGQRRYHSAIGLVMVLLAAGHLAGCRSSAKADPATTWQDIRSDFMHGNLYVAQQEAEQAQREFSASNADWAMKFRLLEAEILTYRGRRPEVISLLNAPGIRYPATGDIAIKRNLLCGLAHAKLGQASKRIGSCRKHSAYPKPATPA